ncbi:unnamed protein product [Diatraea saccharalis]|uniref:Uncharacterized protein n=1 Tax=Diatraea saccharalis TaxID=40085 RepID=A0A9N9WHP5_9NEOP|nr:unnamed protein product [Diatraea saccharalis]
MHLSLTNSTEPSAEREVGEREGRTCCKTSRIPLVQPTDLKLRHYAQAHTCLSTVSPIRATNGGSVHASPAREISRDTPDYQYGRFDASALHIAHALKQTELQKAYHRPREKPIDCYLAERIINGNKEKKTVRLTACDACRNKSVI